MTEVLESGMHFSRFAVGDEPWCVWEWDLPQRNLDFIESLTPEYFEHLSEVHFGEADGEHGKLAAVAIRLGYGQALEAFFGLLCAAIQAPDCVAGWLSRYRSVQLHQLVRDISEHRPILSKLSLPETSWDALANIALSFRMEDQERERAIKAGYARLWARFAHDFSDDGQSHEYNCIKHGLRIRPGGFQLRRGREDIPGVPAPPDRMKTIGASPFGSSMLKPEPVGQDRRHFRLRKYSRNWQVENLAHGLMNLAASMRNVLSFLRIVNGADAQTVQFEWPKDLADFREPWKRSVGVFAMNFDDIVGPNDIVPFTREEILNIYPTTDNRSAVAQSAPEARSSD